MASIGKGDDGAERRGVSFFGEETQVRPENQHDGTSPKSIPNGEPNVADEKKKQKKSRRGKPREKKKGGVREL